MTDRVELRLRGRMTERFVGRALRDGVVFQIVERTGPGELYLAAAERDAGRLMALAEEYGLDLRVTAAAGKPYWRQRAHERGTLALGILMGLLLVASFTSRIWRVETVSPDGTADEALLSAVGRCAQEQGAKPGVLRTEIDRERLAADIQAEWPGLTHVSVRLSGVILRIEIAEEQPAPGIYNPDDCRDLVAARDAVVVRVEPLAGKAAVQPGDVVRRGQILIRGEERTGEEEMRRIRALGHVTGRVWFTAECDLPAEETIRTRTGRKSAFTELRLGKYAFALSEGQEYACMETEQEILPVGGLFLPLSVVRTTVWEAEERTVPLNRDSLMKQGEAWALELARGRLPAEAQETACWVEFTENDGMITARATIEAQMDIAADRSDLTGGSYE